MLEAFSSENFQVPSKKGPINGGFGPLGQKVRQSLTFGFATPKRHILAQNRVFDVFCVKIRAGVLAVDDSKNP